MKKWAIILTICFVIVFFIYDYINLDLDSLDEGELISEHPSHQNEYVARAYLLDEGGPTTRAAIRVEIDYGKETRTIYWKYHEHRAKIDWLDNDTVEINGHKLNIFNDTYNWKKDPYWEEHRDRD